jgi:hypothetical protein
MSLHPTFSDLLRRPAALDAGLPLQTITAPTGEQVRGRLTDKLHAKAWGKLMVGGVSEAPVLDHDDLSDWLDFHVIDLVGNGSRDRYEAGAARWAARRQKAAA